MDWQKDPGLQDLFWQVYKELKSERPKPLRLNNRHRSHSEEDDSSDDDATEAYAPRPYTSREITERLFSRMTESSVIPNDSTVAHMTSILWLMLDFNLGKHNSKHCQDYSENPWNVLYKQFLKEEADLAKRSCWFCPDCFIENNTFDMMTVRPGGPLNPKCICSQNINK